MNCDNPNAFEMAVSAARDVGAVSPEGVAEYLKDRLAVVDTVAGRRVVVRNGLDVESLDGVLARLQVTPNVGALFHGGNVDVRTMDADLYREVRKHKPDLLGLRPKR